MTANEALKEIREIVEQSPELNMNNYDHDQVAQINQALIEIYRILDKINLPI